MLGALITGHPGRAGLLMDDPDPGVGVVLVLTALATGLERLDGAIIQSDAEQQLAPWAASSTSAHASKDTSTA